MNIRFKRLMAMLLCVMMLVSLLPTMAFADDDDDIVQEVVIDDTVIDEDEEPQEEEKIVEETPVEEPAAEETPVEEPAAEETPVEEPAAEEEDLAEDEPSTDEEPQTEEDLLVATTLDAEDGAVAQIGSTTYTSLSSAISDATAENEIVLQQDVTVSYRYGITIDSDKSVTIDLNGHNITFSDWGIYMTGGALTIKDSEGTGVVSTTSTESKNTVDVYGGTFTLESGTIQGNGKGCAVYVLKQGTQFIMSGGTVKNDGGIAVSGNGQSQYAGTSITISGGSITGDIGIYHPQEGTLTITGGTITGKTAVYVKSGTISITAGTLTANGEKVAYSYCGGGCYSTGDALVIDTCGYPGKSATVSITGGTFSSTSASAVASYLSTVDDEGEAIVDSTTGEAYEQVTGFISGGTFTGTTAVDAACVADGYTITEGTVTKAFQVGGNKYDSLQDAINAVSENGTITLLGDTTGAGVVVEAGKNFTLDLNNHTYSVNYGVGSDGTTTNGFQLIKGSTITIKNGTIEAAEDQPADADVQVKHLIQNYCDLTLNNVTLDGTNLATVSSGNFTVSNQGTLVINNSTIIAKKDQYAFDVCVWGNYTNASATVTGNSVIKGKVEVTKYYDETSGELALTITGGDFTGATFYIAVDEDDDTTIAISGGTFAANAGIGDYLAEGYTLSPNGNGTYGVTVKAVAKVGDTEYSTLADAIEAAKDGGTVTLIDDVTLTDSIEINDGMDVTIEGNYTINSANGKDAFRVYGGKLTLNAGLTVYSETDCAIYIRGGEVVTSANLKVNGVYGAIQGNGSAENHGNVTINGGTITGSTQSGVAIYWPQDGKLTINGGTITGNTGVYVKSGTITIKGGTITATGTARDYAYWGNGCYSTGDALVIDTCGYPGKSATVSITGGTFTSKNASAVASYLSTKDNNGNDILDSTTGKAYELVTGFISGGTYNTDVTDLCAEGYEAVLNANGTYGIEEMKVAKIDDTTYPTLKAAFEAVDGDNQTLTLLQDVTLTESVITTNSYVLNGNFTFDGGNHTITIDGDETVSGLYFGYGSDYCSGLTVKNLTVTTAELDKGKTCKARFGIVFWGGTSSTLENVTVTGVYYYWGLYFYGTHGGTMTSCTVSTMFANGQSANPLTLTDCTIDHMIANSTTGWSGQTPIKVFVNDTATGKTTIQTLLCGGTSSNMVDDDVIANNVTTLLLENGSEQTAPVAKIEGTDKTVYYSTLAAAIDAAGENDTVKLISDVTLSKYVTVTTTATLDLNGHTITRENGTALYVNGGNLTIKDSSDGASGEVKGTDTTSVLFIGNDGAATLNSGNIVAEDGNAVSLLAGTFTMNGGAVSSTGNHNAVMPNGGYSGNITITGGTITSEDCGVFYPGKGTLTITGGKITGKTAVYIKSGTANITGGEFVANGDKAAYSYTGSGCYCTGDAVVIENCGYPGGEPKVSITGGTFTSTSAKAVASYAAEGYTTVTEIISGGTFSSDVTDYCVEGKAAEIEDGNTLYTIVDLPVVAKISGKSFYSMDDAIKFANESDNTSVRIQIVGDIKTVPTAKISRALIITNIDGNDLWNSSDALTAIQSMLDTGYTATDVLYGMVFSVTETGSSTSTGDVAEFNSTKYASVQEAINAVIANGAETATVTLLKDSNESSTVLYIPAGVTLDLGANTLTAKALIGGTGSKLTGTQYGEADGYAQLKVETLSLDEKPYEKTINGKEYALLPIYLEGDVNAYVLAPYDINENNTSGNGYHCNINETSIDLKFGQTTITALKDALKDSYSATSNHYRVAVVLTWETTTGTAEQTYYWSAAQVKNACSATNWWYTFGLDDLSGLEIDLNTLTVQPMIITDSGVIAAGTAVHYTASAADTE